MKKIVNSIALLTAASNLLIAGGDIVPMEPAVSVPEKEIVVINDNVKYDGFYAGAALSHMRMNEAVTASGVALTIMGGYYFNKYFGVEGRYTSTVGDVDVDDGPTNISRNDRLSNVGIYLKPMYSVTTGFAVYGLAGYGKSMYEKEGTDYSESGVQWGLGAKYELSNNVGLFADYLDAYNDNNFDGLKEDATGAEVNEVKMNLFNVGAAYTF